MGSGGSKGGASSSRRSIFQSSCLGSPSGSAEPRYKNRNRREPESEPDLGQKEPSRKVKGEVAPDYEMPLPCISSGTGSSSGRDTAAAAAAVHHSPSRCLSGFSFLPGNVSFRLSRANSLGSSRAYPTSLAILNPDDNSDTFEEHPQHLPQNSISSSINLYYPVIFNDGATDGDRDRRVGVGSREPVERNMRFSRTLSVGRLRDRVLRRASLSDFTLCPLQKNNNQTHAFAADGELRQSVTFLPVAHPHPLPPSFQTIPFLTFRTMKLKPHGLEKTGIMIHSSTDPISLKEGEEYDLRTGRCTCRVNNRASNSNDETSARASISRIIMLAEALFEVLDEIHQQSVVLSSRPSVSSMGSVPAPNEVVESLPVKAYKSHKLYNEDAAQCYICLVEYEEGDSMRILPCNHEFHRTCIDKWLKEIHRLCPLCRGDIFRLDLLTLEK
ncbi:Profilin family protein [Hibiscus syriacus]|uniref:Profilin family protein n=1 Tax=Hibiscus syriacus TaxID=106335 RepID=A0A6A3CCD2_HIBSY|nr:Profilin family protein [Hibiscus syriacus]